MLNLILCAMGMSIASNPSVVELNFLIVMQCQTNVRFKYEL